MKRSMSRVGVTLAALVVMVSALSFAQAPKPAKEPAAVKKDHATASPKHELVDLSSATKEQLAALPGIGDAYGDSAFTDFRNSNRLPQNGQYLISNLRWYWVSERSLAKIITPNNKDLQRLETDARGAKRR